MRKVQMSPIKAAIILAFLITWSVWLRSLLPDEVKDAPGPLSHIKLPQIFDW